MASSTSPAARIAAQTLVVVVDRDRQRFFRLALADHVLIENAADFMRRRQIGACALLAVGLLDFLADDVVAQLDAFIADEYRRPGNQLAHFVLALAAEGAIKKFVARAFVCHASSLLI